MNKLDECDPMLDDHINKCRCCFRTLLNDHHSIAITKSIEQNFFDLTNLQLIQADIFSSKICQLCDKDLEIFQNFRKDLMQKQKKLYSTIVIASDQESFNLKEEINEFIDCNPSEIDHVEIAEEMMEEMKVDDDTDGRSGRERRNLKCQNCSFATKTRKSLNKHITDEHKNFSCDKCEFSTNLKTELERHLKSHSTKESQMFYCETCGLNFHKRHLLNRHVKLKHMAKERKFQCTNSNCDKAFFTISALKKHVESHSEKALPCEYCGKLFSCLNNLRTHLYYHSEPKFICDFEGCGKKFFMRKLLKAHINVHRGQKDFACVYCEKSYFFQAHLKRHVISMHMRLKINCELCASSFARKENYRHHVINNHQNLSAEALESLLAKIRQIKVDDYRCLKVNKN